MEETKFFTLTVKALIHQGLGGFSKDPNGKSNIDNARCVEVNLYDYMMENKLIIAPDFNGRLDFFTYDADAVKQKTAEPKKKWYQIFK